jgi:hypothetical protein
MIEILQITCPYCWERIETTVDCSGGSAQYTEDCPVCCQPIRFDINVSDQGVITGFETSGENQ